MARLVVLLPVAAVAAVAGVLVTVMLVLVPPSIATGVGGFQPGDATRLGLSEAQLAQAARALKVADRLKAKPLPVLAMVVGALQESMFRAVPNANGSGYCGVFQADPKNIACGDTEKQARAFLEGGYGFQAGGAMSLAKRHPGMSPGAIATAVEASGDPASIYDAHRPQALKIIRAWRQGGIAVTVPFGDMQGSPKHIIDTFVLPISNAVGVPRTVAQNDAANARHGPTSEGGLSDHQGPPGERWAADMSNGYDTREEAELARRLTAAFDIPWDGSGAVTNRNFHGYRVQIIFRSMVGGNHFTHVHAGIARVAGPPSP